MSIFELIIITQDWPWGTHIVIVTKNGAASASLSFRNDDPKTGILHALYVTADCRNEGYGTYLQETREIIIRNKGCNYAQLWVTKDSWMKKWYNRRGYRKICDKGKKEIWMKKRL